MKPEQTEETVGARPISGPGRVRVSRNWPTRILGNAKLIACAVLLVPFSTVTAYYLAFSHMALYDDEGTMMWSLKRFLEGSPIYDRVPTIYGPLYYFYQWCAHILTGAAVSHHSVRLVSIAFWVLATLIVFLLAYRTTGSLLLACLTHFLAFRAMMFIGAEPAHPQEACMLLLAGVALACFAKNRSYRAAILGVLAGCAVATKINFGVFVIIALSVGFAYTLREKGLRTGASILTSAGMLVFPVLLMWGHLSESWAANFCALAVISIASAMMTISGRELGNSIDFRDLFIAGVCFASTIAVSCCFPLTHGSTLHAMIDWLIVKPRVSFGQLWFHPLPTYPLTLPWAATGFLLSYCARSGRVRPGFLAFCKVAFAIAVIVLGILFDYAVVISFALPLLWLVSANSGTPDLIPKDGRALLLLLSVIQVLYAYPVAGSQIAFASVLIIPIATICLSDGFAWVQARSSENGAPLSSSEANWLRLVGFLTIGVFCVVVARQAKDTYARFEPLGLPGTERMRVKPEMAKALRALVSKVSESACQTLITEPGMFSFNLFTGKPAPSGLNNGAWVVSISIPEEESTVREVTQDPHACVIRRQDMEEFWTRHGDVSSRPMVRYIRENFESALEIEGYSFMVRKN